MGKVVAFQQEFTNPHIIRLMDTISEALDSVPEGKMTVAEAIGALEMAKLNLYHQLMKPED